MNRLIKVKQEALAASPFVPKANNKFFGHFDAVNFLLDHINQRFWGGPAFGKSAKAKSMLKNIRITRLNCTYYVRL